MDREESLSRTSQAVIGVVRYAGLNVPEIMFQPQTRKAPQQEWPVHGILHSQAGVPAGHRNISLTTGTSAGNVQVKNISQVGTLRSLEVKDVIRQD